MDWTAWHAIALWLFAVLIERYAVGVPLNRQGDARQQRIPGVACYNSFWCRGWEQCLAMDNGGVDMLGKEESEEKQSITVFRIVHPGHRGLHGDREGRSTGLLGMQLHCGCSPCSLSGTQLAYRSIGRAMQGNNAFLVWPATILSGAAGGSSAWRWTMEVWTCLAKTEQHRSHCTRLGRRSASGAMGSALFL